MLAKDSLVINLNGRVAAALVPPPEGIALAQADWKVAGPTSGSIKSEVAIIAVFHRNRCLEQQVRGARGR